MEDNLATNLDSLFVGVVFFNIVRISILLQKREIIANAVRLIKQKFLHF